MMFSRARTAVASAVVSSALVLGATGAVQAAPAPSNDQPAQVAARKAPAKQLIKAKKQATKVAVRKQRAYRSLQGYLTRNARNIPASVLATANAQSKAGAQRLDKLTLKVSKAKKVKRVKTLKAKIKAQRPGDVQTLVVIAQRAAAAAAAGDAGLLEDLLDDLLGLDIDGGLLDPVVSLVDELLDSLTGGGGGATGLLDGLLDLLNNLLGGLLGKR